MLTITLLYHPAHAGIPIWKRYTVKPAYRLRLWPWVIWFEWDEDADA